MLKALVTKNTKQFPPKTHDLLRLAELSGVEIDETDKEFLAKLAFYYIETRYPKELSKISKDINRKTAFEYLNKTKALLRWLKQKMK